MFDQFDIDALKSGSAKEFQKVYRYYEPRLNGYLAEKAISAFLNAEVIQQTFIKLWEYRNRLNPDIRLSTQIFQIAKTTLIDELRKQASTEKVKGEVYKNMWENKTHIAPLLEMKETQERISKAIEALPPVRKKVFLLSREGDLSHKEISAHLSISIKTVNKHIQLALKQIKPYVTMFILIVNVCYFL